MAEGSDFVKIGISLDIKINSLLLYFQLTFIKQSKTMT